MSISKWLENNFPVLLGFLGEESIRNVFNLKEEFLALDYSDNEVFEYLNKIFLIKKKGELWLAHDCTVEVEKEKRKLTILKILEDSLKVLVTQIGESKLSSIREKLKDPENMWQGLHEAYVASCLCKISQDIELEVPNPDCPQNNFDIKANINGTEINIEVTTRTDYFPFGREFPHKVRNSKTGSEGLWSGLRSRATVSPAFVDNVRPSSSIIQYDSIPESEDLRRKLLDKAKKQLPKNGINIIALGYRGITNKDFHVTNALYGDQQVYVNKQDLESPPMINRVENGLCYEEDFKHISAVMLIFPPSNDGIFCPNPSSAKGVPSSVQELLVRILNLKVVEQCD